MTYTDIASMSTAEQRELIGTVRTVIVTVNGEETVRASGTVAGLYTRGDLSILDFVGGNITVVANADETMSVETARDGSQL